MSFWLRIKTAIAVPRFKKTISAIFGLAFLIAVIPLIVVSLQYRQELRKAAVGELEDLATLSLSASKTSIGVDETTTVSVYLNPGGLNIYALDVIIGFNEDYLNLESITEDTTTNFKAFLPLVTDTENFDKARVKNCANSGGTADNCTAGTIEFGAAAYDFGQDDQADYDPYDYPVTGNANIKIADLVFKGKATGTSSLTFEFDASSETARDETKDCNAVTVNRGSSIVDDVLLSAAPVSVAVTGGDCAWHSCGDFNCDDEVKLADFGQFVYELKGNDAPGYDGDFNDDEQVNESDFLNFRQGYRCEGSCSTGPWCD